MIQYNDIFTDYSDNGIIEEVDTTEDNKKLLHYVPYHPVVHKDKETKVCEVFDASSKFKAQSSLNDILHSGLCLLSFLQEILL